MLAQEHVNIYVKIDLGRSKKKENAAEIELPIQKFRPLLCVIYSQESIYSLNLGGVIFLFYRCLSVCLVGIWGWRSRFFFVTAFWSQDFELIFNYPLSSRDFVLPLDFLFLLFSLDRR